jgi:hypothetical protein
VQAGDGKLTISVSAGSICRFSALSTSYDHRWPPNPVERPFLSTLLSISESQVLKEVRNIQQRPNRP